MSRIIVKNLPAKATETDVRKHFESKGTITDVRVLRKRDGSSRRFAFVGFRTDNEAAEAAQFFNLSFMNSSRLDVSLAKALGDEELEKRKENLKRKWLAVWNPEPSPEPIAQKQPTNAKLAEFLSVMQPQKTTAMWKNDNADSVLPQTSITDEREDEVWDPTEKEDQKLKGADEEEWDSAATADKNDEEEEKEEGWDPAAAAANANAEEKEEEEIQPEGISDLDWLRKRQTRIKENGEKPEVKPIEEEEVREAVMETEEESNRLFVRNLAFSVSHHDLQVLFGSFGELKQVHIPLDPCTDKMKGIAFVEYGDVAEAVQARIELDGKTFQGRLLHIMFGAQPRGYVLDEFDIKNMPLKKQKALKRRMQASRQQFSWNSLYLNRDAVLEATAAKLGVSKSEMLDPHSSNTAVQQALAESSVLEAVQTYFKSKGVELAKFQPGKSQELSDTVILAKNLPFSVSAPEIQDMFAAFGEVERTLMPPEGSIAIIQFKLPSAGRTAFQKLSFRRVGDSVLYLQKAPKGAIADAPVASITSSEAKTSQDTATAGKASAKDILLPETEVSDAADVRTSVFVKNLSFNTTVAALTKLFQAVPGFLSVTIKTKPDASTPGKTLSMGFGFVEFRTMGQAQAAIKAMDNHDLDGHKLQLKISSRGEKQDKKNKMGSTKIIIKNIPFETSKQDIVDLFCTFGHLRNVRIPKKFNRQSRGFAFAEFATPKEAEHALDALRGAHLLGRRLVLDYAQADAEDAENEIARIEAKVSQQVAALNSHGRLNQQKGFDMEEEE